MKSLSLIFAVLLGFGYHAMAQSGPGGVDNADGASDLHLWLKADAGVAVSTDSAQMTSWTDQSGYGNSPDGSSGYVAFRTSASSYGVNGLPVVQFQRNATSFFSWTTSPLSGATEGEAFVVFYKNADDAPATAFSGFWDFSDHGGSTHHPFNSGVVFENFGSTARKTTGDPAFDLSDVNIYDVWSAASSFRNHYNGNFHYNTSANTVGFGTDAKLGESQSGVYMDGQICEILMYDRKLNDAERSLVNNYLAHRWGVTSGVADDLYAYNATNSNDIAGIGQESDGSNTAGYSSVMRLENGVFGADGSYVVIGHDNGGVASWSATETPNTDIRRLTQEWRVDLTGTVTSVDIEIDNSELPALPTGYTEYLLLTDTDGDFSDCTVTPLSLVSGNVYGVTNTSLSDGDYLAIGVGILPGEPTAVVATGDKNGNVPLSWTAPTVSAAGTSLVSTITDYIISYHTSNDFNSATIFSDGTSTSTSATVTGLTNDTQYYFWVQTVTDIGQSTNSTVATATPSFSVQFSLTSASHQEEDGNYTLTVSLSDTNTDDVTVTLDSDAASTTASVESVAINDGGTGYVDAEQITTTNGGASIAATWQVSSQSSGVITGVDIRDGGAGFTSVPSTFSASASGTGATFTITIQQTVTALGITNGGTGFAVGDTITSTDGGATVAMKAVVTSVSGGVIDGVDVINGGIGFSSAPTSFVFTGSGSGAAFSATLGNGGDFGVFSSDEVTITAGQTSATTTVYINNDTEIESDESFDITLSNPTSSGSVPDLGTNTTFTLTINDDDNPRKVEFASAASSDTEGSGGGTQNATVSVTLPSADPVNNTIVSYIVEASSTAEGGGTDYTLADGTVTINSGQTSVDITIPIEQDDINEQDETIVITLTGATNGNLNTSGNLTHTLTITDDDPDPTVNFTATSSSGQEDVAGPTSITVQLSNSTYEDIIVSYSVNGSSTSTVTDDYTIGTTVTISAGETTANIVPTIIEDVLDEEDETLIVDLSSVTSGSATIGMSNTSHTYTIQDNDPTPTVQFTSSSGSGDESSAETVTVTVQLSSASAKTITVPFSYDSGTAVGGGQDFTETTSSPLTFSAGETSKDIVFVIVNENTVESTETVQLDMGSPTNVTASGTTQFIYTVTDDDADEVGPAGIGGSSDLAFWLRAHDDYLQTRQYGEITKWGDLSGNGNTPTFNGGNPTYIESNANFNGYSTVEFDGTTSSIHMSWGDIMSGASAGEIYVVMENTTYPTATSEGGLMDFGSTSSTGHYSLSNGNVFEEFGTTSRKSAGAPAVTLSDPHIYHIGNGSTYRIFWDGASSADFSSGSNTVGWTTTPKFATNGTNYWAGSLAEIMVFTRELTTIERVLIDNYLTKKYSIGTPGVDIFDHGSSHGQRITGIGQVVGTAVESAHGISLVRIYNPSDLANGEYLMWGDDGALGTNDSDLPTGETLSNRWARTWKVSHDGDVGTVTVAFDLSGVSNKTASDLYLIVDNDNDGGIDFNDETVTAMGINTNDGYVDGDWIIFDNVTLNDGDVFTLATADDANTNLPVTLLHFDAKTEGSSVVLDWATAQEVNNAYFTVERSIDGKNFYDLAVIDGMGTKNTTTNYEYVDTKAFPGINYYRLKQTDYDGTTSYERVVSASLESTGDLAANIFPNPARQNAVHITSPDFGEEVPARVTVYNTMGMQVLDIPYEEVFNGSLTLDLSKLTNGMYFIEVLSNSKKSSQKLVLGR